MMVVIAHIEAHKVDFGFGRFTPLNLVSMGRMGVTLFFVILFISRKYLSLSSPALVNAVIYSFTIVFTIVIAGLSYKYYESYFLTIKKRFARIEKD